MALKGWKDFGLATNDDLIVERGGGGFEEVDAAGPNDGRGGRGGRGGNTTDAREGSSIAAGCGSASSSSSSESSESLSSEEPPDDASDDSEDDSSSDNVSSSDNSIGNLGAEDDGPGVEFEATAGGAGAMGFGAGFGGDLGVGFFVDFVDFVALVAFVDLVDLDDFLRIFGIFGKPAKRFPTVFETISSMSLREKAAERDV